MHHIKELRKSTKLSQEKFAEMFHIPVSTLRKWEQNDSTPPSYVLRLIENALPISNKQLEIYYGVHNDKYFYDRDNSKVGDSLGNWISFNENLDGVIADNIGIYIENLFQKYYEAIKEFENEIKLDKMHHIKWR